MPTRFLRARAYVGRMAMSKFQPCIPTRGTKVPAGPDWIHEIKHDGYRHGLRAAEIAGLQWDQVEFGRSPRLHVRRVKGGTPSVHPIHGDELRMLTGLRKAFPDSTYVFTTERGTPFTADAVNRLIKIIGARAELSMPIHAHMLRHSCGYALANKGVDTRAIQAWMGHASIVQTTRYTALAADRFKRTSGATKNAPTARAGPALASQCRPDFSETSRMLSVPSQQRSRYGRWAIEIHD